MKNFKLLLGATAILSMSAMAANAESTTLGSAPIRAKAYIVDVLHVREGDPLDFGLIDGQIEKGDSIMVEGDGTITILGEKISLIGGYANPGTVEIYSNSGDIAKFKELGGHLSFPDKIIMTSGSTYCGYVDRLGTPNDIMDGDNLFEGRLNFSDISYDGQSYTFDDTFYGSECAGSGTVTLVLGD